LIKHALNGAAHGLIIVSLRLFMDVDGVEADDQGKFSRTACIAESEPVTDKRIKSLEDVTGDILPTKLKSF
jgi:isopentenyl phosphate kinase